jgi:cytochrome c peroxidase
MNRDRITAPNIAKAISAYERTLLTPSPFDDYIAGNQEALSSAALASLAKFINTSIRAAWREFFRRAPLYSRNEMGGIHRPA